MVEISMEAAVQLRDRICSGRRREELKMTSTAGTLEDGLNQGQMREVRQSDAMGKCCVALRKTADWHGAQRSVFRLQGLAAPSLGLRICE